MPVPEPADTSDLRSGAELHHGLLDVLPLVGHWAGYGTGIKPGTEQAFDFAQRVSFVHDGRPFLGYESRTWLLDGDGEVLRPAFREQGFLRPGRAEDELEWVLATAAGIVEIFTGTAGDRRWEFATTAVGCTPSAKEVAGERRLYGLTVDEGGETLGYVQELALQPGDFQPHLNGRLRRS
jgi:hypothetical protein